MGGDQFSGHQRLNAQREVDAALLAFYEHAREIESSDERAAILLLRIVARDYRFDVERTVGAEDIPSWMKELFEAHHEALVETFHRPDHGRKTDYGVPDAEKGQGLQDRTSMSREDLD
jgi:hypothetical protein